MLKFYKQILEDKYKKLANLKCDLAVFDTLSDDQSLGDDIKDKKTGETKTFDVKYAKEHLKRQIVEVERAIEVNKKMIQDVKKEDR